MMWTPRETLGFLICLAGYYVVFGQHNIEVRETTSCNKGYTGTACDQDIDECQVGVCYNEATCANTDGGFTCTCTSGWTGVQCSDPVFATISIADFAEMINLVTAIYQEGRGTCSASATSGLLCQCGSSWKGIFCQIDRDECEEGICGDHQCENRPGSYQCTCNAGWTGQTCSLDVDECQLKSHDCDGHQCVNNEGSFTCTCNAGFTGATCDEDINECETTTGLCQNGLCVNKNGYYVCSCYTRWCSLQSNLQDCQCAYTGSRTSSACPSSCYTGGP